MGWMRDSEWKLHHWMVDAFDDLLGRDSQYTNPMFWFGNAKFGTFFEKTGTGGHGT